MRMRSALAASTVFALLMLGTMAAGASGPARSGAVIEVFPGPNAIGNAIDIAVAGDVLNIHAGTYPERVIVDVAQVTLRAAGDGLVTVDGSCTSSNPVDVRAESVTIQGLRVIGAGGGPVPIGIDFSGIDRGRVMDSTVEDTCGNGWYGINVFAGGSISILRNTTSGFSDAGIYVGAITSTPFGPMVIRGNDTFANGKGVIVQDSTGAAIDVTSNNVHDNETVGIWLNNTDGIRVQRNVLEDNVDHGIELDATSDGTLVRANNASGHTFDLYDGGGSGNCWRDNVYVTSFGDISC